MIEQKILDKNFREKNIKKENYSAFWLKSFSKGDHYFLRSERSREILFLNNDKKYMEKPEEFVLAENNNSKIFAVGFLENKDYMKIVHYYGNGSTQDIYHKSHKDPSVIIIKKISNQGNWLFWLENLGYNKFLYLNKDSCIFENQEIFSSKPPNQHYFRVSGEYNENNEEYIAIIFFNSKTFSSGIYKGGTDKVKTNIKNDLVIIKNITSQSNWRVFSRTFSSFGDSLKINNDGSCLLNSKKIITKLFDGYFVPELNCNSINKEKNMYVYISFEEKSK